MFDFDKPVDRRKSDSAKWQKYKDKDIIPMWVADMDFHSPPAVMEALHERVEHGVFGYGRIQSSATDAICTYLAQTFNWQIDLRWLIWLPGVVTGLNVACRSSGSKGDSVMTTIPVYPPFLSSPLNSQRRLASIGMVHDDHRWLLDFDALDRSMGSDTAMFILCNPHNPTGRVFDRRELKQLAEICLNHDAVICSDEIHCDLILNKDCQHLPIATLSDDIAQNTITLMAPSKSFNIPGLGCSFAVIPNDSIRRRFKQAMAGIVPHVNVMGLVAARAAYQKGWAWLESVKQYLSDNHQLVYDTINAIDGLRMLPAEATYLAWIDSRGLNVSDPARFFELAGIGLSDGKEFKGPGYVRLNFGCSRPLLSQALDRIATAVAAHKSQTT